MVAEDSIERLPPYVSYKTWNKLLDALVIFTPDEITNSYYKDSQFLISSAKKLRTALHFLGLVDDRNVPTTELHRLIRAHGGYGQERKADVLRDIINRAYHSIFEDNFKLEHAAQDKLEDRFKILGVRGETRRHCISFFLHLAADAELELSPHLAGRSRLGVGRKSIVLKSRERRRKATLAGTSEGAQLHKGEEIDLSKLHPALAGLLKELPTPGIKWEAEEKARFKKAFEALLDVVYPDRVEETQSRPAPDQ